MPLVSLEELSKELSVPCEYLKDLINKKVLTPYGGNARFGEPRFSTRALPGIRAKIRNNI